MVNLKSLGLYLAVYANDHNDVYPPPERWCDAIVNAFPDDQSVQRSFCCPMVQKGPCDYAMNPHAGPRSNKDVVLLFESRSGWNQSGGPELLTTENHRGEGCTVVFADLRVEFVKAKDLAGLTWTDGTAVPVDARNGRRPQTDGELRYWLENMVWGHGFATAEIRAATGLADDQIAAAQERFGIRPDNRPVPNAGEALLVLPYPGGRHPRIGFLEGAIDP